MGLIDGIIGQPTENARATLLGKRHPIYEQYESLWKTGMDAYDGSGGFLNGGYLWRFPRETEEDINSRRMQARYHNYVDTLIDIYVRNVTTGVTRTCTDEQLSQLWENVDGRGTSMTTYVSACLAQALAAGHAATLVDKAPDLPTGPSLADDPHLPYLTTFASPAMLDWRTDAQGLAAIKLHEALPMQGLDVAVSDALGYLLWDRERWARFDDKGKPLGIGDHQLEVV